MPDEPQNEEKKIIIDEDWKSQVEAERAATEEQASAKSAEEAGATEIPLPPASLSYLTGTLYVQGMISLGMLPAPSADKPVVRLDHAKHAIDVLQILHEKTEGNRTPEETEELNNVLHELRLAYVGVQGQEGKAE